MAAADYPAMLSMIAAGRLRPQDLVTRELSLAESADALVAVGRTPGIAVITSF